MQCGNRSSQPADSADDHARINRIQRTKIVPCRRSRTHGAEDENGAGDARSRIPAFGHTVQGEGVAKSCLRCVARARREASQHVRACMLHRLELPVLERPPAHDRSLGCCRRERRVHGSRHSDGRRIRLDRGNRPSLAQRFPPFRRIRPILRAFDLRRRSARAFVRRRVGPAALHRIRSQRSGKHAEAPMGRTHQPGRREDGGAHRGGHLRARLRALRRMRAARKRSRHRRARLLRIRSHAHDRRDRRIRGRRRSILGIVRRRARACEPHRRAPRSRGAARSASRSSDRRRSSTWCGSCWCAHSRRIRYPPCSSWPYCVAPNGSAAWPGNPHPWSRLPARRSASWCSSRS